MNSTPLNPMTIRPETLTDVEQIRELTTTAFATAAHSSGTEAAIIEALRAAGALTFSFVAESDGELVGHVAFSPVRIGGFFHGWYGLGPVSVYPPRQREGIGNALIQNGLQQLEQGGANGCVVLGEPAYYARFGFRPQPSLRYPDTPSDYFLAHPFTDSVPFGAVTYHNAFDL